MQAYCVRCRGRKEIRDAQSVRMKNGRPATRGVCASCGGKVVRLGRS